MTVEPGPPTTGPATAASRRRRPSRSSGRAYPRPLQADPEGGAVLLAATRALVAATSREEVARVLRTAVHDWGGGVVPARLAAPDALPLDVSLGIGEPLVVMGLDALDPAVFRMRHHLPGLFEDALVAAARCDDLRRARRRASGDALTGVADRSEIGPRLAHAVAGDVVCLVELAGLAQLTESRGHSASDDALAGFGELLRSALAGDDFCGLLGGSTFLVLLAGAAPEEAAARMRGLVHRWLLRAVPSTSVAVGLAAVGTGGPRGARAGAERALARARRVGRKRVQRARPGEGGIP